MRMRRHTHAPCARMHSRPLERCVVRGLKIQRAAVAAALLITSTREVCARRLDAHSRPHPARCRPKLHTARRRKRAARCNVWAREIHCSGVSAGFHRVNACVGG
eukprot:350730-Chlamydomonas_euryale.AAC.3